MSLLAGVRVFDLSRVMSGPYCTAMLADLGAEVIKVESPGAGDDARHFGPFMNGASVYFALLNRSKKSIALNLKHAAGREIATRLAAQCDVVVENFRPGVAARLGLDYATLGAANPGLVYLSISGFGQKGPFADRPAYDLIVQAMSGVMSITGQPEGPPTALGESLADIATGMFGAFSVAAALFERSRTHRGRHIDLAMFDSLLAMQVTALSRLWASGQAPARVGNRHPVTTPVDCFRASDGLVALVIPSDVHFRRLCELIGEPALAGDPRFSDNASRARHEAALKRRIEAWTERLTVEACVEACRALDLPAGPVWDLRQAASSPHTVSRELLKPVAHREFSELRYITQPARFGPQAQSEVQPEPRLGEHTHDVLARMLSLSDTEIQALERQGAIAAGR